MGHQKIWGLCRESSGLYNLELATIHDSFFFFKASRTKGLFAFYVQFLMIIGAAMTINLWSPASRSLCLNSRPILQTCYKIDSLAARLAQRQTRSISNSCSRALKGTSSGGLCQWSREAQRTKSNPNFGRQTATRSYTSKRILTEFNELPKDYNPKVGLPFRATPLTKDEVAEIFGKRVDTTSANRLLKLLHGCRVAGTLEDPNSITTVPGVPKRHTETGLEWLRKTVPVNEVVNAGLRAEEELAAMGEEVGDTSPKSDKWEPNKATPEDGPYGNGVLSQVKKMVKADQAREAARKEQEEKEKEVARLNEPVEIPQSTSTSLETMTPKVTMETYQGGDKYKHWVARAKTIDTMEPPVMTSFQRLFPSALVVLATIAASITFVLVYTPPKNSARLWPDTPPSAATIAGIIVINTAVLIAWRIPPAWRFMNKYFYSVTAYPYALSSIGNIFSHTSFTHYAVNMALLWFIGTRLHDEIGRANFLAVYVSSGVFGTFASLTVSVLCKNMARLSLGASGAICGLVATYLTLNASNKVDFFGFPPEGWPSISALSLLGFVVFLEAIALRKELRTRSGTIDHVSHLGGYAAGIGCSQLIQLRQQRRRAIEIERRRNMGFVDSIKEGRVSK